MSNAITGDFSAPSQTMKETEMSEISNERLDEMLAGLEGVTRFSEGNLMRYEHGGGRLTLIPVPGDGERRLIADFYHEQDREHFVRCDPDTMRSILTELRDLRASPSGVEVKGLEWVKHPTAEAWRTETILGTYQVWLGSIATAWQFDAHDGTRVNEKAKDEVTAKAAAEADYRTRILSCLTSTAPTGEAEPVAGKCICNMPPGFHADACPARVSPVHNGMAVSEGKFRLGERVRKTKGASWQGRIVGFYSTSLTPIGYAVESEREPGSVQIYPEAALEGGSQT